jgi:hypothetical protein
MRSAPQQVSIGIFEAPLRKPPVGIPNVAIKVAILGGSDQVISSFLRYGKDTGTSLTGLTGTNGQLNFTLEATGEGYDELSVSILKGADVSFNAPSTEWDVIIRPYITVPQ